MASHTVPIDHEHHPGDGCQTVQHDDHVDHVHGEKYHPQEAVHVGHAGAHTEGDGCQTVAMAIMWTTSMTATATSSLAITFTGTDRD
jgi:hypothetical protein